MLQTYQLEKHQNQGVDVLEISEVLDKEFDRKVSVIEPTHKREREREGERIQCEIIIHSRNNIPTGSVALREIGECGGSTLVMGSDLGTVVGCVSLE